MKKLNYLLVVFVCIVIYFALKQGALMSNNTHFVLASSAFKNHETIPPKYTCGGANISPQLEWSGAPNGTKVFVLIVDDPDAQSVVGKTFVHWIVINIPTEINSLSENVRIDFGHAQELMNDFGKTRYGGPCPPDREHQYHFALFAMNKLIDMSEIKAPFTAQQFRNVLKNAIIAEAQLIGKVERIQE